MLAVDIRNLNFRYDHRCVFKDFNLEITKGSFVTVLGRGGSGKSTFYKILSGTLHFSGTIMMHGRTIGYNLNKDNIGLISAYYDNFKHSDVMDELTLSSKLTLNKTKDEITRLLNLFDIEYVLDKKIDELTAKEKILILFVAQYLRKSKIIIMENAFSYLDDEKSVFLKELIKLNKKDITVINITNEPADCLYGNTIVFLDDEDTKIKVKNITEKDFLDRDLECPFMISLSEKLKMYGVIDKTYLVMEKMVDDLWP